MRTTVRRRRAFAALSALSALVVLAGCSTSDGTTSAEAAEVSGTTRSQDSSDGSSTDGSSGSATSGSSSDGVSDDTSSDAATSTYVDGTYTADGTYVSPGGSQSVTVTLTIADDAVTAVEVTPGATDATSEQYQEKFASGVASEVVGVALDDLDVDKVAGSSLTSQGFDDAVAQIQEQARA